ncbi:MAG: glycyl-radical enzyme activating protein [Bacteroidales bacterium]|nr:glycyl-radical enzyme activating protein [Bacteroidales bacterium]
MKLRYFDISWISSVDGPGTRVVLYLQGCHLRCSWCHSPQSWKIESPLLFFENRCQSCGNCVEVCSNRVHHISDGIHSLDRNNCNQCGACIKSCPVSDVNKWNTGALGFAGKEMDVNELYQLLKPQLDLLKSIGGITISGGDPLLQSIALRELLKLCKQDDIHITVETSASLDKSHIEVLLPYVDHWLIGLRPSFIDKENDWEQVLKNVTFLAVSNSKKITIRTPIIPGYTNTEECHDKIKEVMLANEIQSIEILPFNPFSENYYKAMGILFPLEGVRFTEGNEMNQIKNFFISAGIKATVVA